MVHDPINLAERSVEDIHTFHADTKSARQVFRDREVDFSEASQASAT